MSVRSGAQEAHKGAHGKSANRAPIERQPADHTGALPLRAATATACGGIRGMC